MKANNWIAIGSAFISALLTAIGLYFGPMIAVKRALEQFRSTKWWEKQCAAYDILLESLSVAQYVYGNHLEAITLQSTYTPSDFLKEKLRLANHEIEKHTAQGVYLLTEEAAKALKQYQRDHYIEYDEDLYKGYERAFDAARMCIETLTQEAKQVLLLQPSKNQ
jgi:hypothetical protein